VPGEVSVPSTDRESGGNGGQPTTLPEASRHGQETAAEHKATGKGKSREHSTHPPHSSTPRHSKGQAKGGQGNSKASAPQAVADESTKANPAHAAEPPGQAKSEVPAEPNAAEGKGKADESEPSP
jgi:hypothetical protein